MGPASDRLWEGMAGMTVAMGDPLFPLVALSVAEAEAPRCGADHLLKGYVQSFVVHLLRQAIEEGAASRGVLAGLADPRLARVLVALHEAPAKPWKVEAMCELAGMSRSAFMARFAEVLGEPPTSYLRRFRLEKARAELDAGGRVGVVARRYGYASPDAFTRAMKGRDTSPCPGPPPAGQTPPPPPAGPPAFRRKAARPAPPARPRRPSQWTR